MFGMRLEKFEGIRVDEHIERDPDPVESESRNQLLYREFDIFNYRPGEEVLPGVFLTDERNLFDTNNPANDFSGELVATSIARDPNAFEGFPGTRAIAMVYAKRLGLI